MQSEQEQDCSKEGGTFFDDVDYVVSSKKDYRLIEDKLRNLAADLSTSTFNVKSPEYVSIALSAYFNNDFDTALQQLSEFEASDKFKSGTKFVDTMSSLIAFKLSGEAETTNLIETGNIVNDCIEYAPVPYSMGVFYYYLNRTSPRVQFPD